MKKIFTLLAILLVLVLPIVSCSSDDVSAKQAETDRESLEIPNDEDHSNIQFNQLALYVSKTAAQTGEMVTFTTVLNGVDVTNQVSYFINNIQIGGYSIASNFPGTFQIQAKMEGYIDSPVVTVVYGGGVNPDPEPNPNGNFIYNGQGHTVTNNILVFLEAAYLPGTTNARSFWQSIIVDNTVISDATVGALIDFHTPFTITDPEEGLGNIVFPNGNNEVYTGISQLLVNGVLTQNIVGTGTIHYTNAFNPDGATNPFTSNVSFAGNTLQINFNGAFDYIDGSQNARPENSISQRAVKIKANSSNKVTNNSKFILRK